MELGANLLGQERVQPGEQGAEEGSTSGVSTVNSVKSQKTADSMDNKYLKEYRDQMESLKAENMRLLQELIENQKSYQTLLHQTLEDQQEQINKLARFHERNKIRASTLDPQEEAEKEIWEAVQRYREYMKDMPPGPSPK